MDFGAMEVNIKSEPSESDPEPMDTGSEAICSEHVEAETENAPPVPHSSQAESRLQSDTGNTDDDTACYNQRAESSAVMSSASMASSSSPHSLDNVDLKPPIDTAAGIPDSIAAGTSKVANIGMSLNGAAVGASGQLESGDGYKSDGPVSPVSPDSVASSSSEGGDYAEFSSAGFGLTNLLEQIEGYKPTIPEPVADYFLHMSGFQSSDPRVSKLISIAAQKFISDILNDAFTHCKLRTAAPIGGKTKSKDKKYVLTLEDLVPVLSDYGITVKKPPYFV